MHEVTPQPTPLPIPVHRLHDNVTSAWERLNANQSEVILSINRTYQGAEVLREVHRSEPLNAPSNSRILCEYTLLGRIHDRPTGETPFIECYYVPLFEDQLPTQTLLTLLGSISGESSTIILALSPRKSHSRYQRLLSVLTKYFYGPEDSHSKVIGEWDHSLSGRTLRLKFIQIAGKLNIPEHAWVVSSPESLNEITRMLQAAYPESYPKMKWYKIATIQKEKTNTQSFPIAS